MKLIGFLLFATIGFNGIIGKIVQQEKSAIKIIQTNMDVYATDIIISHTFRVFETTTEERVRINELRISCNQIDGYCPVNRWNVVAFGHGEALFAISSQNVRYVTFTYLDSYGSEPKSYTAYNECDTYP